MPVLRTSGSFRRYFIEGAPIDASAPETYAAIAEHSFRGIDDSPVETEAGGWVSPWDPTGRDMREEDVRFGYRIALAIRLDRKRVPGALIKIHTQAEERAEREALGVEFLPKKKRQEIKDRVGAELLARALPNVALHQVFIDTQRRIVLLQGTSDRLATTLAELFHRTFERGLREATAGPLAERLETDPQRLQYIDRVGPLLLMPPTRRIMELVPFESPARSAVHSLDDDVPEEDDVHEIEDAEADYESDTTDADFGAVIDTYEDSAETSR
jgi:hypothetical protein